MSTLARALAGHWTGWTGLEETDEAAAVALLGDAAPPRQWARLSRRQVHTRIWPSPRTQLWFDGTADTILMAEVRPAPARPSIGEIVAEFGSPRLSGPPRVLVVGVAREYVYLDRGVAFTLGGDPENVLAARVFAPADEQFWLLRFGGGDMPGPG